MADELAVPQERSERISRLKRFLAPQVAELVEGSGEQGLLDSHRAEVVVVFCDLRGFTGFAGKAEVMGLLQEYYEALGAIITRYEATLTCFMADGLMLLLNAPVPRPEPALLGVRMVLEMQVAVQDLIVRWRARGYAIGFGVGLAKGTATVGRIGYEGRLDYTAIGSVVNLASRLCASAEDGQIVIDPAAAADIRHSVPLVALGTRTLRGFAEPVAVFSVTGHDPAVGTVAAAAALPHFRASRAHSITDLPGQWIDKVHSRRPPRTIVLDMDSSESPTYGEQEGSAYNGHFGCTCYHPLFVFNQLGDVERCALRSGSVHSAEGWRAVLEPVIARYRGTVKRLYFRGDAAFANPEMYEFLEGDGIGYTIRLPANRVLQDKIGYLLKRPVGRPPHEVRRHFASFSYQAQSWKKPRRVVAKVEWHPGELYPRVGFIVTNLARPAERVVAFYNQRGTAEQWIKEGKGAIKWTRLSCRTFTANAVRLQLHALAYNLGNFMRTLAMPKAAEPWSLTSLREKLIKIGAKVVSHGRYVTFQMAEVAVSRQVFAEILSLIARLRAPPASA
jgi:class 3 adenylate cyclase